MTKKKAQGKKRKKKRKKNKPKKQKQEKVRKGDRRCLLFSFSTIFFVLKLTTKKLKKKKTEKKKNFIHSIPQPNTLHTSPPTPTSTPINFFEGAFDSPLTPLLIVSNFTTPTKQVALIHYATTKKKKKNHFHKTEICERKKFLVHHLQKKKKKKKKAIAPCIVSIEKYMFCCFILSSFPSPFSFFFSFSHPFFRAWAGLANPFSLFHLQERHNQLVNLFLSFTSLTSSHPLPPTTPHSPSSHTNDPHTCSPSSPIHTNTTPDKTNMTNL